MPCMLLLKEYNFAPCAIRKFTKKERRVGTDTKKWRMLCTCSNQSLFTSFTSSISILVFKYAHIQSNEADTNESVGSEMCKQLKLQRQGPINPINKLP